ncbi:unnamed protein product [Oncorhynchus mykiss]|uniref:SGNH hydrolase-type esterase domain-containing protein n=1 Tax=Oncorhynchus mykiss TaxID=8022 RepID=A0A060XX81_ONCMY|nr:unnamed protein product [Oncorhynchus mykiss]
MCNSVLSVHTAMLYLGQVAVANENLFTTSLPGEIKNKQIFKKNNKQRVTSLVSTPPVTGSEMPKLPTISSDKLKTLVIGDSITRSIRLKTNHPAIIHCLPGGRATDVKANLKMVLAKAKTGECREYRDIVIHIGTNDVRMKQSSTDVHRFHNHCFHTHTQWLHTHSDSTHT